MTPKTESRDRLYFDCWEYALSFWLKEAHTLRHRDEAVMIKYIQRKISWPGFAVPRYSATRYDDDVVPNLRTALAYINGISAPFKIMVSGHWVSIYTNDPSLADDLIAACPFTQKHRLKQAVVDRPRDTVLLFEPTHKLRSYFKSQQFPGTKIPALREFFAAQGNAIKPSPAMQLFLRGTWQGNHWLPDHYYVDYDDPQYATMLALIMPRPFRKTVPIVQRINS